MRHRVVLFVLFVVLTPANRAGAQLGRAPQQRLGYDPQYWVGLSYGYVDGTTIYDGDTGRRWQFGYSSQIRATAEKTIQRGVTAGVSAGFSNARLTYSQPSVSSGCGTSCAATADITQYMAFIHGGNGLGFHGAYDLEAGLTEFSNFRSASNDVALEPASGKYDFSFGFGGGLGFGFSRTTDVYIGEMFDFVLHPQGSAVATSAPRLMVFRAGARIAF